MECLVQQCPSFLQQEFMLLFPDEGGVKSEELAVITLAEKTVNDMTGWSPGVEEEREQLLEHVREMPLVVVL